MKKILLIILFPVLIYSQSIVPSCIRYAIHDSLKNSIALPFTAEELNQAVTDIQNLKTIEVTLNPSAISSYTFDRVSDTLVVDSVYALVQGTDGIVEFNIAYGTNRSSGTNIFTLDQTADNITIGETFTTINNATIPKNNLVWLDIVTTENSPNEFMIKIYYH